MQSMKIVMFSLVEIKRHTRRQLNFVVVVNHGSLGPSLQGRVNTLNNGGVVFSWLS